MVENTKSRFKTIQVIILGKKDLCSQTFTTFKIMSYIYVLIFHVHYHSGSSLFSHNRGIPKPNPDLVPNSGPFPDHFWHFGPDPD